MGAGRGRQVLMATVCRSGLAHSRCNSALKDALPCIRWDARALIDDGQHRLGAVAAADQPDQRARRRVGGSVVEQVPQDADDGQRVGTDQQLPSSIDGDPMVG
jgi:hypothetical protein